MGRKWRRSLHRTVLRKARPKIVHLRASFRQLPSVLRVPWIARITLLSRQSMKVRNQLPDCATSSDASLLRWFWQLIERNVRGSKSRQFFHRELCPMNPSESRLMSQESSAPERDSFSPQEYASKKGLSIATVRRYLKKGSLPKSQPGGPGCRVLIPVSAIGASCESVPQSDVRHETKERPKNLRKTPSNAKPIPGPTPRWRKNL